MTKIVFIFVNNDEKVSQYERIGEYRNEKILQTVLSLCKVLSNQFDIDPRINSVTYEYTIDSNSAKKLGIVDYLKSYNFRKML